MKRGDKFPVTIAGHTVAQAEVREVGDGQVVLIVPGTVVTMATRTQIDAPEPVEPEKETIVTGVERTSNDVSTTTVEGASSNVQQQATQPDSAAQPTEQPGDGASDAQVNPEPRNETTEVGAAEQVAQNEAGTNE